MVLARIPPLLWLWLRLAATAPIRSLAWEPRHAGGAALKGQKTKKKKKIKTPEDPLSLLPVTPL